ncbi:MAG: PD40 domain-containing protein, partial [Planctomycetes bacterium]|nr:PD40 domain-containing protein [Planctomycetota bacterium]
YDRQTDTLELIPGATQDTCVTSGTSINADGRYVAFATDAPQLVPGDTNGARDIFVYDRQTQAFERVSVASDGSQGDSSSFNPSISADGRFVVFSSYASNLVANDSNNREDVFVHDRQTGTTELVSVLANGSQFSRSSDCGTISADGRYVAFRANGVYVHDRTTGTTECVSMAYDGSAANDHSGSISLSADGRYVVFSSEASNLVPGDTNGEEDVFVYDRQTGTMRLVSTGYSGLQGNGESWRPVISADGQFVAFESEASTLVPGDTNGFDDIFVRPTAEVGRFGMHVVGVGDGDTVEGVDFGNRQIATSQIDVMLVPVVAPSAAGADALPEALEVVPAGQPYYVELWVQDTGLPAAGVTAGTVDLHYATALADATGVVHLDFDLLPSGQIDDAGGLIDDLGGGTMSVGAGVAPAWTRMAYVEFFATGTGQVAFELSPGSLQFSRAGAGNVAWDFVSLDSRAMVSQIGAAPRVDAALVRQPTSFDQAETGEVAILPSSEAWIHEWEPFWIELWVSTPEMALLGVSGGTVDLSYATEYATAVAIQYGPAFTQNRSGTIADPAGLVDNVGAVTPRTDVGDDQFALLARIRFEPTAEDQAPMQEATHFMGPYDLGLELNEPHLELVGVGPVPAELGTEPSTDLYAVPYDIDDNDQVDFGDLSYFTPAFGRPVGQIEPPYTWWADFDHSGLVDFGDFSDFAANFRRGKPDAEVTMPTGYPDNWHAQQTPTPAEVVGRHVFYNNSVFDGDDPAANAADDAAVAPDKAALMPDQTATFANYTSYVRGINGVMIDVVGLPDEATLDADDFEFRVGNGDAPSGWADAPAPVEISIRAGAGIDGSDRVTIVWPDCAVAKQWLQVTVLPTLNTKLTRPDVFYFGNAVGEAGNATADAKVNAVDVLLARNNPRTFLDPASADFPYDFNRDARVNATDMLIARQSPTHMFNALRLISAPSLEADPAAIVAYFARVLGGKTTESGADKAWALPDRSSACDAVLAVASPQDDGGGAKASAPWDWLYEFEYAGGNHRPAQQRDLADSATVALAMHDGT